MKGETIEEIAAAASVMRELAAHVDIDRSPLIDTCGTGGDGIGTFNISTAAAFVVAAAGETLPNTVIGRHPVRAVAQMFWKQPARVSILHRIKSRLAFERSASASCSLRDITMQRATRQVRAANSVREPCSTSSDL